MRYCLILLLILTSSKLFATQYEWQFTHFKTEDIYSNLNIVSCLDTNTAIVARTQPSPPYFRMIEHTSDYGTTWDTLYFEEIDTYYPDIYNHSIYNIKYLDKNNIIATYGYRNFLQSTDGGKSWIDTSYFDDSFAYNEISSFDSLVFVAGATDQYMGVSKDLGKTWRLQEIDINLENQRKYDDTIIYTPKMHNDTLYAMVHLKDKVPFLSQLNFFTDNLFMFSTDKGENWQKLTKIDDLELSKHYAIDDNYFYTQSVDYSFDTVLVNDPNGGDEPIPAYTPIPHWQMVKINKYSGDIEVMTDSLSFTCGAIIDLCKFDDYICISTLFQSFYSSDYGETWIEEGWKSNQGTQSISNIERVSMSKGFMVGNAKFATLQPTTSVTEQNKTLQYLHLYPNPAAPGSKINLEFDATEAGKYSFRLSSMDGRNIDLMQNDFFSQGRVSKSIELNSNLTAGTYVLSIIKSGEIVSRHKFIVQ